MASELIRYRPGEAIRWLKQGAIAIRRQAKRHGASLVRREGARSIGKDLSDVAGAIFGAGKSAIAELIHRQASATEYLLSSDAIEILKPGSAKRIPYEDVTGITLSRDKATVTLKQGSVTIAPYAYIVAGRVRVPVGWLRNDVEVPYELLIDELAARCGLEVEES